MFKENRRNTILILHTVCATVAERCLFKSVTQIPRLLMVLGGGDIVKMLVIEYVHRTSHSTIEMPSQHGIRLGKSTQFNLLKPNGRYMYQQL
jgi:hypothetical protein